MATIEHERRATAWLAMVALVVLALYVGGFSAFVGWNKAFAPMEVLAQHSAWTIHLPVWLGRTIGWLEMAAAAVLIGALPLARFARAGALAAGWITLNHAAAAVVHVIYREWHTLQQSAISITVGLVVVTLYLRRGRTNGRG